MHTYVLYMRIVAVTFPTMVIYTPVPVLRNNLEKKLDNAVCPSPEITCQT
jgi:hypothetical protein